MALWFHWYNAISLLRPVCSRSTTFLWFMVCVAGLSVRDENLGVTSIVRALSLKPLCYQSLLRCFHSNAIKLDRLYQLWAQIVLKLFDQHIERVNGRIVFVADGKKIAKSGKKMPAVKKLYQESDDNTKAQFIMGHSTQCVGVLASKTGFSVCMPLIMRIHEGLIYSNRDTRSLLDKLLLAIDQLKLNCRYYLVADAYYGSGKLIKALVKNDNHLISRAKSSCVAYHPAPKSNVKRKVGRPKLYGRKVSLRNMFNSATKIERIHSPVYQERSVVLQVRTINLIWKPLGKPIRFVLVEHPIRGSMVLMCSDLTLDASEIIRLYGLRFKIEVSFKQASQVIGSYDYHFWMATMKRTRRHEGNRYLHMESEEYRAAIDRKMHAYHVFLMAGVITQGLTQYLSLCHTAAVWRSFGSWLRTIRQGVPPSELVVTMALRNTMSEFLIASATGNKLAKFIVTQQVTDYSLDLKYAA